MKFGIVVFPGSNCDRDMADSLEKDFSAQVEMLWHKDSDLSSYSLTDCIILPGGFSFGDSLRCGAIARFSPMMQSVITFANQGGRVFGVCNGFQVLCEAHLLPGALLRNANQQYICKNIFLTNSNAQVFEIPIAHGEGRYFVDDKTLQEMETNGQILFRYCDEEGEVTPSANPNGSINNIAGIRNKQGNVIGMMPHPERATSPDLFTQQGRRIMEEILLAPVGR